MKTTSNFIYPEYTRELEAPIMMLKDGIVLATKETSKDCAIWLLENGYIKDAQLNTVARSIRKALKKQKLYHDIEFRRNKSLK